MTCYLVTGCAGFIGAKVAEFLLADGHTVVGVDNLNDAYDVQLKHWRLARLQGRPGFEFHRLDIADREMLRTLFERSHVDMFNVQRSNVHRLRPGGAAGHEPVLLCAVDQREAAADVLATWADIASASSGQTARRSGCWPFDQAQDKAGGRRSLSLRAWSDW